MLQPLTTDSKVITDPLVAAPTRISLSRSHKWSATRKHKNLSKHLSRIETKKLSATGRETQYNWCYPDGQPTWSRLFVLWIINLLTKRWPTIQPAAALSLSRQGFVTKYKLRRKNVKILIQHLYTYSGSYQWNVPSLQCTSYLCLALLFSHVLLGLLHGLMGYFHHLWKKMQIMNSKFIIDTDIHELKAHIAAKQLKTRIIPLLHHYPSNHIIQHCIYEGVWERTKSISEEEMISGGDIMMTSPATRTSIPRAAHWPAKCVPTAARKHQIHALTPKYLNGQNGGRFHI